MHRLVTIQRCTSVITVVDNSGVRVYYTDHLRANDAGIMAVGMAVSPMHIVPPRQSAYRTASLCDKDCTNVIFPERGIKITSVLLHAHLASRQLKLRHVRHDQEMATIAQVMLYYSYAIITWSRVLFDKKKLKKNNNKTNTTRRHLVQPFGKTGKRYANRNCRGPHLRLYTIIRFTYNFTVSNSESKNCIYSISFVQD